MRGKFIEGTGIVKIIAMIPARMGSQRLKQKNLCEMDGVPLIQRVIQKCRMAGVFDEIWVNTEADELGRFAELEGVGYHKRPAELANNQATSEQFVYEFLQKHDCDFVVQVHSIAPLLRVSDICGFVGKLHDGDADVLLSVVEEPLECLYKGAPVNFTFERKQNSQELTPVEQITWSITAWRRRVYMDAFEGGKTATYAGRIASFAVNKMAGHVIKTEEDLTIAIALASGMKEC